MSILQTKAAQVLEIDFLAHIAQGRVWQIYNKAENNIYYDL